MMLEKPEHASAAYAAVMELGAQPSGAVRPRRGFGLPRAALPVYGRVAAVNEPPVANIAYSPTNPVAGERRWDAPRAFSRVEIWKGRG